mmetsp:Transcript_109488/g.290847  ORF Transcript_109488/g.290847 Transcript_109488/m.290847 type:complete len:240 (-) Transcript_109488:18-737(-)
MLLLGSFGPVVLVLHRVHLLLHLVQGPLRLLLVPFDGAAGLIDLLHGLLLLSDHSLVLLAELLHLALRLGRLALGGVQGLHLLVDLPEMLSELLRHLLMLSIELLRHLLILSLERLLLLRHLLETLLLLLLGLPVPGQPLLLPLHAGLLLLHLPQLLDQGVDLARLALDICPQRLVLALDICPQRLLLALKACHALSGSLARRLLQPLDLSPQCLIALRGRLHLLRRRVQQLAHLRQRP